MRKTLQCLPDTWPTVTIIVPVFNEGFHVLQTTKSFSRLDYPENCLAIVFVDDSSTDDHVMCLSGCMTLYTRAALLAVDKDLENRRFFGEDVKYGEDRFLTRKLLEYGYKTRLCFEARCYTKAPPNMQTYLKQQLRWRRSNAIDFITALPHLYK